ncbi:hypothetical protein ACP4OV_007955 [Aristida adscensionis]
MQPLLFPTVLAAAAVVSVQCDAAHRLLGREKVTHLHFFLHDTLSGKDPSAVLVARGAGRAAAPGDPVPFSSVYAADDALTAGPVVGSAQGLYLATGRREAALVLGMDFELTGGPFAGSAFVVFSRNTITRAVGRELAVFGGRGAFRMARGFALLRTHYLDAGNGDAVIEYNVTLLHY